MKVNYPKISIITPVFNQENFLEQTILSVLKQNYPNLEYIIIDGGSTDGALEIIKKYESQIAHWISEPDNGMYDALNKGFALSTGDIMGWINSDDVLLHNSLFTLAKLFGDLDQVNWIQGINSFMDEEGNITNMNMPDKFSFLKFLNGNFKWVQQESTFWRRSLWEQAGGKVNDSLKFAGDFELWFRFFQFTKLYNARITIGAWRKRKGQLTEKHMSKYLEEVSIVINSYIKKEEEVISLNKVKKYNAVIKLIKKSKVLNPSYFILKRNQCYNIDNIEIKYSLEAEKFIV